MHPLAFPKHSTMFPLPQTQYDAPVGHHTGEGNMALQWSGCPLSKKGRWPSQVYVRILPSEFQNRNWNSLRVYSAIRFSLAFGYADPLWLGQKYSKLCDSTMEETPTTEDEEQQSSGHTEMDLARLGCGTDSASPNDTNVPGFIICLPDFCWLGRTVLLRFATK